MTLPMTRRLLAPLAAALVLGGAAGCVDLKETPITGITAAYYNTPGGFDAAVNATYTPLRSHWALERGATMTVFGTDEYQKGADGSYKFFNDYTAQLTGDVDFIRNTWTDFYTGNASIGRAAALDGGVAAEGIAGAVALAGVRERHRHRRVGVRDVGDRNAVGHGLGAVRRPEVRVQRAAR